MRRFRHPGSARSDRIRRPRPGSAHDGRRARAARLRLQGQRAAFLHQRPHVDRGQPAGEQRHRGAEAEVSSRPLQRHPDRRQRHERAEQRLRRLRSRHHGDEKGRQIHPQRQQNFHHQRPGRRHARGLRQRRQIARHRRHHARSSWRKECPGFDPSHKIEKMGVRTSPMSEVFFENCEVPEENLLGKEGGGSCFSSPAR